MDIHCFGGSGTSSFILTPVQAYYSRFIAVKDEDTLQIIDDLFEGLYENEQFNPRFIDKATFNPKNKQMMMNTYIHDDKDPNNFPSLKYQVTIDFRALSTNNT